jgi:HemY protein
MIITIIFAAILNLGGQVMVDYQSYKLTLNFGVFALLILLSLWIVSFITKMMERLRILPMRFRHYREIRSYQKGLSSLAFGLAGIAAGNIKQAEKQILKLTKYLKNKDEGLVPFMRGMIANYHHNEPALRQSCHGMMAHKATSFIGLKGLIIAAMKRNDNRYALILAEKTHDNHGAQPWLIETLYDLYILNGKFNKALQLTDKYKQIKNLSSQELNDIKANLYAASGDINKAYKLAPHNLNIALKQLDTHLASGKYRRKSLKKIEKLWAENPHPDLMDNYIALAPKKTIKTPSAMMAWIEKLYKTNENHPASILYVGQALINIGEHDQADIYIRKAFDARPTPLTHKAMHLLDYNKNREIEPLPDQAWVSQKTGEIFDYPVFISDDGHVGDLVWGYPDEVQSRNADTKNKFTMIA